MRDLRLDLDTENIGSEMFGFAEELFPICRSITGNGIDHLSSGGGAPQAIAPASHPP